MGVLYVETKIQVVPNPSKPFDVVVSICSDDLALLTFAREGFLRSDRLLTIEIGSLFEMSKPFHQKKLRVDRPGFFPTKMWHVPHNRFSEEKVTIHFRHESHAEQFAAQINGRLQETLIRFTETFERVSKSKYYDPSTFVRQNE